MMSYRSRGFVAILVVFCLAEMAHAGWWLKPRRGATGRWYVAARPVDASSARPLSKKSPPPLAPRQTQVQAQWQYPVQALPQTAVGARPTLAPAASASGRQPTVVPRVVAPRTPAPRVRYGRSTVAFNNQSGEPALVRLVGPTRGEVYVASGASNSIRNVAAGHYVIRVRYGAPGNYRYAEGDPFDVHGSGTSYSHTTITLHTVPAGNYAIRFGSAADFNAAAP